MAASSSRVQYIRQQAQRLGLDPAAVLAIASHEGLSGGIGDGGHAFGPFQENNAGGVLTGRMPNLSPQQLNAWAWSPAGIQDALSRINSVAHGLHGDAAIRAIATRFERPANLAAEIGDAQAHYGDFNGGRMPAEQAPGGSVSPSNATAPSINAGGSLSRQQLAELIFGGANRVDFNSNQMQVPNLLALAMARQQAAAAVPSASAVKTAQTMTAPRGYGKVSGVAGGFLAPGSPYQPGRIDQGHDFQTAPGAPIVAPGDGKVVAVKSDPHGFGPAYPIVHFTSGPYAGKDIYIGHTLAALRPGQTFRAGQTISHTGTTPVGNASVPGWAEIGFSTGSLPSGQSPPF